MFPDIAAFYLMVILYFMHVLPRLTLKQKYCGSWQAGNITDLSSLSELSRVLLCTMSLRLYILILVLLLQTTLTWGPYLWFHMLRVATSTLSGIALVNSYVNL